MDDWIAVYLAQLLQSRARETPLLDQVERQPLKSSGDHAPAAGPVHAGHEPRFPAADRDAPVRPSAPPPVEDPPRAAVEYPDEQVRRPATCATVNHAIAGNIQRGDVAL